MDKIQLEALVKTLEIYIGQGHCSFFLVILVSPYIQVEKKVSVVNYSRVFRGANDIAHGLCPKNVTSVKGKNMSPSCPISTRRVDANMVRIISFQVALFTLLFLITQESFFAGVILFDFFIRALRLSNFSLFQIIGKFVLKGWGVAPKLCDESPKRFALYLGLVTSLFIVIFYFAGFALFATVIAVILLICALLETLFDFCIGCKLYYAIQIGKGLLGNDRNIQ